MNNLNEALSYIIETDKELQAIEILMQSHKAKHEMLRDDYHEVKSALKAIHKINNDKGNTIHVLSDV